MGKVLVITESQYNTLLKGNSSIVENIMSPLKELMGCQILEDRQHIVYEGKTYNTITGDEVVLSEQALGLGKTIGTIGKASSDDDDSWSLSDILHTGVDIISTGVDFIAPGAGATIDVVHGVTYLIEAQFNPAEKDNLYVMGAITFAFALMPGALQLMAPVLKRFVKSGGKMIIKDAPMLARAWKWISSKISTIVSKLPGSVEEALKTKLGQKFLGKHEKDINKAIAGFSSGIKRVLDKLSNTTGVVKRKIDKIIPLKKQRKLAADKLRKGTKKWSNRLTSKMDISQGNVRSLEGNAVPIHTQPGQSIIRNDKKLQKHFIPDTTKGKHGTWVAKNSDEGKKLLSPMKGQGSRIGRSYTSRNVKEVNKNYEKLTNFIKGGTSKGTDGRIKRVLRYMWSANPINAPFKFAKELKKIFVKGPNGWVAKDMGMQSLSAIAYAFSAYEFARYTAGLLCRAGIKNAQEYEAWADKWSETTKWDDWESEDDVIADLTVDAQNSLAFIWNNSQTILASIGDMLYNVDCEKSDWGDEMFNNLKNAFITPEIQGKIDTYQKATGTFKEKGNQQPDFYKGYKKK